MSFQIAWLTMVLMFGLWWIHLELTKIREILERVSTEQTDVCPDTAIEARDEKGQTQ